MRKKMMFVGLGLALASAGWMGCSVSVSASAGTNQRHTLAAADKIMVTAAQPAEPPKPVIVAPPKPVKAVLVDKKIEITEKVMFDNNKSTIKPESNDLLTDVATVMKDNPSVTSIRVEGHTDSNGKDKYNKKLSQGRADAVKAFLVQAGIDAGRMEAVGFGEEKPIADNATDEGREKNRRVEFNIVAQDKQEGIQQ